MNKQQRKPMRRWTAEEDAQIARLRVAGLSVREIAAKLDRPIQSTSSRVYLMIAEGRAVPLSASARVTASRTRRTERLRARAEELVEKMPSTKDAGYVIGVLYGDGFVNFKNVKTGLAKSIGLTTTDEAFRDAFAAAVAMWVGPRTKSTEHTVAAVIAPGGKVYQNVHYFNAWLHDRHFVTMLHEKFGPTQTNAWKIDVDAAVARGDDFCRGLVQGLFDSDGSIGKSESGQPGHHRVKIGTCSSSGCASLFDLLCRMGFGVTSAARPRPAPYQVEYHVSFSVQAIAKFATEIGSRVPHKRDQLDVFLQNRNRILGTT